jgi:beta-glucosidase/6-phospho-beta-glucosidase/beta-galactosidase
MDTKRRAAGKAVPPVTKVQDNLIWELLRVTAREDEIIALDALLGETRRKWEVPPATPATTTAPGVSSAKAGRVGPELAKGGGSGGDPNSPLPPGLLTGEEFLWATAIEATNIPQLSVDQMAWSQHNIVWRQDLARIRHELGVRHVRLSPPWHRIHVAPDRFDWKWLDEYLDFAVGELELVPLLDLCHFGTPLWLPEQFGDPEFPAALETWAEALAKRYGDRIRYWTPVNEPYITALFCGDFGFWPPYWRYQDGFVRMAANIAKGIVRAQRALRSVRKDAVIVHVDTVERAVAADQRLFADMTTRNIRRFIVTDMMAGRIDDRHPLWVWLLERGFTERDAEWFRRRASMPDILGLDYYPQAEVTLFMREKDGQEVPDQRDPLQDGGIERMFDPAHRAKVPEVWPAGLYVIAREYYDRYRLPMMITETNWAGPPEARMRWLDLVVDEVRKLREHGFPMVGLTWWGAYDHLDWGYALRLPTGQIHHVGLWELERRDGILFRKHTPMVDRFRHHTLAASQGPLASAALTRAGG